MNSLWLAMWRYRSALVELQPRTLACGESAAPKNSKTIVWVFRKDGPPAHGEP
jgi:hypothetical protein